MGDVSRVKVQQGSCVAHLLLVLFTGVGCAGITSPVCMSLHPPSCLSPSLSLTTETEHISVDLYLVIMVSLK